MYWTLRCRLPPHTLLQQTRRVSGKQASCLTRLCGDAQCDVLCVNFFYHQLSPDAFGIMPSMRVTIMSSWSHPSASRNHGLTSHCVFHIFATCQCPPTLFRSLLILVMLLKLDSCVSYTALTQRCWSLSRNWCFSLCVVLHLVELTDTALVRINTQSESPWALISRVTVSRMTHHCTTSMNLMSSATIDVIVFTPKTKCELSSILGTVLHHIECQGFLINSSFTSRESEWSYINFWTRWNVTDAPADSVRHFLTTRREDSPGHTQRPEK